MLHAAASRYRRQSAGHRHFRRTAEEALRLIRGGAFDVLRAPVATEQLCESIQRLLGVLASRLAKEEQRRSLERYLRQLERRVHLATQELARALAGREEFLNLVSHELRTPVTVIHGNADLLFKRGAAMDRETRAAAIADLRQETRRLLRTIENVMAIGRDELPRQTREMPWAVGDVYEDPDSASVKTQVAAR